MKLAERRGSIQQIFSRGIHALAGSQATGLSNSDSVVELYVDKTGIIPLHQRHETVAQLRPISADLDLQFGPGDEWL